MKGRGGALKSYSVPAFSQTTKHTQMIHGAGIFTYIWIIYELNVAKYTIHGSSGI